MLMKNPTKAVISIEALASITSPFKVGIRKAKVMGL
jgi:hypothetical protein